MRPPCVRHCTQLVDTTLLAIVVYPVIRCEPAMPFGTLKEPDGAAFHSGWELCLQPFDLVA